MFGNDLNNDSPRREFRNFLNDFEFTDEEKSVSQQKQVAAPKQKPLKKQAKRQTENTIVDDVIQELQQKQGKNSRSSKKSTPQDQEELYKKIILLEEQQQSTKEQRKIQKLRVKNNYEILEEITEKWQDMKEIINDQNQYIYKLEQIMRMLNNGFDEFQSAFQSIENTLQRKKSFVFEEDNDQSSEEIVLDDTSLSFNNIEQQNTPQIVEIIEDQYSEEIKKNDDVSQVSQIVSSNRNNGKQKFNKGAWSKEELSNYVEFILKHDGEDQDDNFFLRLSQAIKTRNQTQCRVFHKLFIKKQM